MSGMKLIMESWRSYLKEGQSDIGSPLSPEASEFLQFLSSYKKGEEIEEGLKTALKGAGLAAALAAGGLSARDYSAAPDVSLSDVEQKIDPATTTPAVALKMPTEEMSWSKAPTGSRLIWVTPAQITDDYILPSLGVSAGEYKNKLTSRKIRGTEKEYYDIGSLEKMLFGNSGIWAYTQKKDFGAFDIHPELQAEMLPPAWSIAFEVYAEKVEEQIRQVHNLSTEDLEELAEISGVDSSEDLLVRLKEVEDRIVKRKEY